MFVVYIFFHRVINIVITCHDTEYSTMHNEYKVIYLVKVVTTTHSKKINIIGVCSIEKKKEINNNVRVRRPLCCRRGHDRWQLCVTVGGQGY